MLTETMTLRRQRQHYPTDLIDAEQVLIESFLQTQTLLGAPRGTEFKAVVDAIFYKLRPGC